MNASQPTPNRNTNSPMGKEKDPAEREVNLSVEACLRGVRGQSNDSHPAIKVIRKISPQIRVGNELPALMRRWNGKPNTRMNWFRTA